MITADEIRRIARAQELAVGIVEKDYALTWLLRGFYSRSSPLKNSLVLKGGTAIRKTYFPETWRFSEDLDFTVIGNKEADKVKGSMQRIFGLLLSASGLSYSIDSFHPTEGSIIANVRFLGPLNFPNRIKHDITLNEKMVLKPVRRPVKSSYPDIPRFNILAYSLTEILVEKVRSIMQRGYSRDYYDVWKLMKENKFRDARIKKLLVKKCELNGIKYQPRLLFNRRRLSAARSFWQRGLGHLTRELPSFEAVVSELRGKLSFLQE